MTYSRRKFLSQAGAAAGIFATQGAFAQNNPLAFGTGHFPAKAKSIIWLHMTGAPSQMDTFDYKPELIRRHGQSLPGAESLVTFQGKQGSLNRSPWAFQPYGQSGKQISDLVPHIGQMADELCFIHSLTGKTNTHGPAENYMCTGYTLEGFPSMGAWTSYALGSENDQAALRGAPPSPCSPSLWNILREIGPQGKKACLGTFN